MRAERTQYAVPGWGEGELWMRGGVVLAHEFAFTPVSDTEDTAVEAGVFHGNVADLRARAPMPTEPAAPGGKIGTGSTHMGRCLTPGLDPDELVHRFAAFLAGDDVRFDDVQLDLDETTPFQHAVATTLRTIPRGDVVSYGELAALAGYPGAARAAGTFCARNRFMLLVPCHRVVGATGIGGYGSAGVGVKRRLLALEGVVV